MKLLLPPPYYDASIKKSGTVGKILYLRRFKCLDKITNALLAMLSVDIPRRVVIGKNVILQHNCYGTVMNCSTVIKDNVQVFNGVTIGRGDIWNPCAKDFEGFLIEEGAILCTGCKIISSHGKLIVGKGTIIGANAVLTKSTGDYEIWAGIPAKKIRNRETY